MENLKSSPKFTKTKIKSYINNYTHTPKINNVNYNALLIFIKAPTFNINSKLSKFVNMGN